MKFIGLNIGRYDSSISVIDVKDNVITDVEHILSERIEQKKHAGYFPLRAAKYVLRHHSINELFDNVSINSFYFHPTYLEENLKDEFKEMIRLLGIESFTLSNNKHATYVSHHLAHAYSMLSQYPFDESLILVADGGGNTLKDVIPTEKLNSEDASLESFEVVSIYHQRGSDLKLVRKQWAPLLMKYQLIGGIGSLFEHASKKLFGSWEHSGKVMGLSSYANGEIFQTIDELELNNSFEKIKLSKDEFDQLPDDKFNIYARFASSVQKQYEQTLEAILKDLKKEFPHVENLAIAGGCALNCLANGKMLQKKIFKNIYVSATPSDMGISLGTALYDAFKKKQIVFKKTSWDEIDLSIGPKANTPELNDDLILKLFKDYKISKNENIHDIAAELVANGEIVSWYQGRSEPGERALGNRSILALPSMKGMKAKINDTIKFREKFRPYGCSLLQEDVSQYFEVDHSFHSVSMAFALPVRKAAYDVFSEVMHVDHTSRLQTVTVKQNERYYKLLKSLKNKVGHGVVLNTSLNIMGKPIVETIQDLYEFYSTSQIQYLIVGDYLITKR